MRTEQSLASRPFRVQNCFRIDDSVVLEYMLSRPEHNSKHETTVFRLIIAFYFYITNYSKTCLPSLLSFPVCSRCTFHASTLNRSVRFLWIELSNLFRSFQRNCHYTVFTVNNIRFHSLKNYNSESRLLILMRFIALHRTH